MQESQNTSTSDNTKRIARNTILLYFRTLFTMAVTLYTSRVILNTLGVDDYGIYNVVGGFVAMFAILSSSLSNAISRFLTYELGHGDKNKLNLIFCTGVNIQIGMSLLIVVVCEAIGIWFLNYEMSIPTERIYAANWVLQLCMLTFCINLISVPYNAAIIAHEKMDAYAYISILEVLLTLGVVYLLVISPIDKLIAYSILLFFVKLLIRFIYGIYCGRNFEECKYHLVFEKSILKEMSGFAGWNFFGNAAYLFNTQGVNMLMNIFFGVAVNAARGVAAQVDTAVKMFVGNFMTAVNPQITKSYASGDLSYMHMLIYRSSKLSGYLLLYFAIPVLLEADEILYLWLKNVPDYTAVFLKILIVTSFFDTVFSSPMVTAVNATGKIKKYQIIMTLVGCLVFPVSWIVFKMGGLAWTTYVVYGIIYFVLVFIRLFLLRGLINLDPFDFIKKVMLPYIPVVCLSVVAPLLSTIFLEQNVLRLLVTCIVSVVSTTTIVYTLGLTKSERAFIYDKFIKRIIKR